MIKLFSLILLEVFTINSKMTSNLGSFNLAITLSYVSYNELTLSFLAVLNDNFYS